MKKKLIKFKEILIFFSILAFIFQDFISRYVSFFDYYDEILELGCCIAIFINILPNRTNSNFSKSLIFAFLSLIICLLGNLFSSVTDNYKNIALDILILYKPLIIGWGFYFLIRNSNCRRVTKWISTFSKILFVITLFFGILNLVVNLGMSDGYRYGIRTFTFIFKNPGSFYWSYIVLISFVVFNAISLNKFRKTLPYIFCGCLSILLTLRTRVFVFLILLFALYAIYKTKFFKRYYVFFIPVFFAIIIFISMDQIGMYYNVGNTNARAMLLKYSMLTAIRYFPLGSGFSTYGTYAAYNSYSSLYLEYGFMNVYGLGLVSTAFATDNYFAAILAEFGFFGLVFFAFSIYFYFKANLSKGSSALKISGLFIILCIIISSFVAGSFFHGALVTMPLALLKNSDYHYKARTTDALKINRFILESHEKKKILGGNHI